MKNAAAWRSLLVKLAGSVIILILLFRFIDFDKDSFLLTIKDLDIRLYVLSLTGVVLVLGIKSFRWQRIIMADGHKYKFSRSFGAYMASFTIGIITPGRIGEIARLYYLRQDTDIGFLPAFKTIVSDRIFDLGVLVMLGIAGLLHYLTQGMVSTYLAIVAGILIFFMFLFLSLFIARRLQLLPSIKNNGIVKFAEDSLALSTGKKAPALWLITLLAYLVYYGAIWLIFKSIGIELPLADIAIILSIVGLATILPISWAGFGTREISLVYLLSKYQIPAETAISFSLLQFGAFFLWGSLIGLVFWLLMPVSLKQIKEDGRAVANLVRKRKA
jgi:glycosyltransferase 2 family protein